MQGKHSVFACLQEPLVHLGKPAVLPADCSGRERVHCAPLAALGELLSPLSLHIDHVHLTLMRQCMQCFQDLHCNVRLCGLMHVYS